MYHYIVGYGSHEENPEIVLVHEKLFNKVKFRKLCASITANIYKKRKTIFKEQYTRLKKDCKDLIKEGYDPKSSFQYLYNTVVEELIKKHDFQKLEITCYFSPFGWAKFLPKTDWKSDCRHDKDLKAIRKLL